MLLVATLSLLLSALLARAGPNPPPYFPKGILPTTPCTLAMFKGKWGYQLSGTLKYVPKKKHAKPVTVPYRSLGYMVVDGKGSFTGESVGAVLVTSSKPFNPEFGNGTLNGTYSVTTECGIQFQITSMGQTQVLYGYLNAAKTSLQLIAGNTPGTDLIGTAAAMNSACTQASVKG